LLGLGKGAARCKWPPEERSFAAFHCSASLPLRASKLTPPLTVRMGDATRSRLAAQAWPGRARAACDSAANCAAAACTCARCACDAERGGEFDGAANAGTAVWRCGECCSSWGEEAEAPSERRVSDALPGTLVPLTTDALVVGRVDSGGGSEAVDDDSDSDGDDGKADSCLLLAALADALREGEPLSGASLLDDAAMSAFRCAEETALDARWERAVGAADGTVECDAEAARSCCSAARNDAASAMGDPMRLLLAEARPLRCCCSGDKFVTWLR